MLRFGPQDGPVIVAALPLFEEANRTRAFVVTILRALGRAGFNALLPDVPGTGDSLVATADADLADWRSAFAAAGGTQPHALSVRGGALIPGKGVKSHWQFAPLDGESQVRELERLRTAGGDTLIGGNVVSAAFLAQIASATPSSGTPSRTVRLDSDPRDADLKVAGTPLWRRAEPDNNVQLAERLAEDIATWVRSCDG